MDDSKRADIIKVLKTSAAIVFSSALAALLLCTVFLGNSLIEMFTPLLVAVLFFAISFLFERIPPIKNRKGLKISLQAICAVLVGVLLSL